MTVATIVSWYEPTLTSRPAATVPQTLYVRPVLLEGAVGVNVCPADVPHTVLPGNVQAVPGVVFGG